MKSKNILPKMAAMLRPWFAAGCLMVSFGAAAADGVDVGEPTIPKYLQIARDFVAHTKPENNSYSNRNPYTRMPGDLFATEYVVASDCSRFVEDMFRRGDSGVIEQLRTQKFKGSHSIYDWHASIEKEEAFTRVRNVADIQVGDVAAWLYLAGAHTLPGHILFIDSVPVKLDKPRKPLVEGLDQYEVTIVDTSQEAKSRDDTRFVSDAALRDENEAKGKGAGSIASPNNKGVGRGHIRFYTDASGDIRGVAFSFNKARFHANGVDWNIVVGHPRLQPHS